MSYNTTNRGYLSQVDTPSLVFAAFALMRTQWDFDTKVLVPTAHWITKCEIMLGLGHLHVIDL
jgi:hypothetical protein